MDLKSALHYSFGPPEAQTYKVVYCLLKGPNERNEQGGKIWIFLTFLKKIGRTTYVCDSGTFFVMDSIHWLTLAIHAFTMNFLIVHSILERRRAGDTECGPEKSRKDSLTDLPAFLAFFMKKARDWRDLRSFWTNYHYFTGTNLLCGFFFGLLFSIYLFTLQFFKCTTQFTLTLEKITILSSDISLDTHGIDVMVQPRVAVVLEVLMSLSLVMHESRWGPPRQAHQGRPVIRIGIVGIGRGGGGVVEFENVRDGVRHRWPLHGFT